MTTQKKVLGTHNAGSNHWVGDGFPVRNLFPSNGLESEVNPFLMLDYAGPLQFEPSKERRGVGEHPHRGFETVTIAYQGSVGHRDSAGNSGVIYFALGDKAKALETMARRHPRLARKHPTFELTCQRERFCTIPLSVISTLGNRVIVPSVTLFSAFARRFERTALCLRT